MKHILFLWHWKSALLLPWVHLSLSSLHFNRKLPVDSTQTEVFSLQQLNNSLCILLCSTFEQLPDEKCFIGNSQQCLTSPCSIIRITKCWFLPHTDHGPFHTLIMHRNFGLCFINCGFFTSTVYFKTYTEPTQMMLQVERRAISVCSMGIPRNTRKFRNGLQVLRYLKRNIHGECKICLHSQHAHYWQIGTFSWSTSHTSAHKRNGYCSTFHKDYVQLESNKSVKQVYLNKIAQDY